MCARPKTHLTITDDQATLLIPRYKHDLLVHASIQLIQTSQDMRQIHDRFPVFVDLVEDIVPEQFDDISVTCLGPPGIVVEPALRKIASNLRAR